MHARKFPCFVRFSTINGAPHFGHGSVIASLSRRHSERSIPAFLFLREAAGHTTDNR
jgi:hypothetical protein